jgi:hypothetical protein
MSDERKPTLEYRPPRADRLVAPREPMLGQCVGGIALTGVWLFVGAIVVLMIAAAVGDLVRSNDIATAAALVGVGVLVGLPIWISVRCYRRPHLRGYALGIWIGIGLVLLLVGGCFAYFIV